MIIINMPISAITKITSAIVSSTFSVFIFSVRMDIKDVTDDIISSIPIKDVISSNIVSLDLLGRWIEVSITRQNPKRPTEVFKMCCEVLFAILFCECLYKMRYIPKMNVDVFIVNKVDSYWNQKE